MDLAEPARARVSRRAVVGLLGGAALTRPARAEAAVTSKAGLYAALDRYMAGRSGTVAAWAYDRRNDSILSWRGFRNETLSIMKVVVAVAVLRRGQDTGRALTSTQKSLLARMIQVSDNSATDTLIAQVGISRVRAAAAALGMRSTVLNGGGSGGWWGYSTTVPLDQIRLMYAVAWGTSYLTSATTSSLRSLMAGVTSSQRWGVCDPPLPTSVLTQTKNGWGPMTGGYRLNSIGHVRGNGRDYVACILSRSPLGFSYGKATVNGVSRIVYDALATPLS